MIDSQRGAKRQVGYNHLISNKREWNNCFIKNHQQILLDFADFAWLEQPEGNLRGDISRVWYNGSYTIAAKPIKTLELHYTMIQFLIICIIYHILYLIICGCNYGKMTPRKIPRQTSFSLVYYYKVVFILSIRI